MMSRLAGRRVLVTGGTGFIGSALVRGLLRRGAHVRCLDNNSRGAAGKLGDALGEVEVIEGDIRDAGVVAAAVKGMDSVCHLAYVNGTEFFYEKPDLVLDVAVKGMMNVLDACLQWKVRDLVLASSSEVYQTPPVIPTPEDVPLVVPDVFNPRYSYGGGKIISELLLINYGRKHFDRAVIFRPHNVYGPDMGREHVIPQFALRMRRACEAGPPAGVVPFPIQGTGEETRSFIYIDDFTEGLLRIVERGAHLQVYHIGTREEVTITEVARLVAQRFEREIELEFGAVLPGSTARRCPDVSKLEALGFEPSTRLADGIASTVDWYRSCPIE
ncbi:MAG: SDR family NAD(P)-dependent oxidoreductase [Vicinamibacterales bacterium]|nr:SDR family NAD(P)-dependent oxidoreductase [Vicinamibacterales bacterium]